MSRKENKISLLCADFSEVWERLIQETDIKYLKDVGGLVGVTQQNVSIRKQENLFPYGWAFPIAQKYNLLTEWILTGEGPKRLEDPKGPHAYNFPILENLDQWLTDLVVQEPYRRDWFKGNLEDAFPMFKEWMKRREEQESKNADFPDKDIA